MGTDYRNTEILAYAHTLALRDYDITVTAEQFADGTIGYLAHSPELPGCKAQGRSVIEATKSLIDARIDTIYFMLVDFVPVPPPNKEATGKAVYQTFGLTTISASAGVAITPQDDESHEKHIDIIIAPDPMPTSFIGFSTLAPVPFMIVNKTVLHPRWDMERRAWVYSANNPPQSKAGYIYG